MGRVELTFITPCYNSAPYLERTYRSLCDQKGVNITWVVVDDASSDGTPSLIRSLSDRSDSSISICPLFLPKNCGPAYATSIGMGQVTTEFFGFLDSDDWLEPGGVEQLVQKLVCHPGLAVVYGQKRWFSEDEQTFVTGFFPDRAPRGDPFLQLVRGQFIAPGQCVVRTRDAISALDGRLRLNAELHGQNLQLLLPLAASGSFRFFPIPIVNYRIRRDSISHRPHEEGLVSVMKRHRERHNTIAYCMRLTGLVDDRRCSRTVARLMDLRLYREIQRYSHVSLATALAKDMIKRPILVLSFVASEIRRRLHSLIKVIRLPHPRGQEPNE